jgi:S1-C subfamily serine protease
MAASVVPGEWIREETHVSQILRLDSHIWRWTVALPLLLATLVWAGSAHARAASDSFADLVEKLLPVVVNISTTQVVESSSRSAGGKARSGPVSSSTRAAIS